MAGFILGFGEILAGIFALAVLVVAYYQHKFNYWKSRNIKHLKPKILFGNLPVPFKNKLSIGVYVANYYRQAQKLDSKHCGFYVSANPSYFPIDLDYVQNVLIRDFSHFTDRGTYYNERDDPLSAHMFSLEGAKWRHMRTKLTPTFTSGKMKMMFGTLVACEKPLLEALDQAVANGDPLDIKDILACFTTDIIGSCAFGIECNSFKVKDSDFRKYGKRTFTPTPLEVLRNVFAISFKDLARALRVRQVSKDISDFFGGIVRETVAYREKNNVTRKDFLQLLIDMKNDKQEEHPLTMDEISAQSFLFFAAGFETSSTTMTFALYELARNPDIQTRLREEVRTVLSKHGGEMTYEAMKEMKYMNQVIDETLRKYPPVPFLTRKCVKDYQVPNESLIIEEGTTCFISVLGIQHDPQYYPEPEKFDPERFDEQNRQGRHPCAWLPFGDGPRNCIGLRFGVMQTKVGLAAILNNYRISVNPKTKEPLTIARLPFILTADGEVWLNAEKI